MIRASLILVKFCDFAKMAFVCEHHGMGYKEIDCNFYKSISINLFVLVFKTSHNSQNMTASVNQYAGNSNCLYI